MNVQQSIIKGIKELLYSQDYLVIPKFGGFVLKSQSAQFSVSKSSILPPSKHLSFNAQLKHNDGVLMTWLQNNLNCDYTQAQQHVIEFSEFCSGLLSTKRRLTFEGIGFFYLDFENNICFEPQADINFLTSSFGLTELSLKELDPETPRIEPKRETIFVDRPAPTLAQVPAFKAKRRPLGKIVMIALLAVFFLSTVSLLITNVGVQGHLRSSLFGASKKGSYQPLNYPEFKLNPYQKENSTYVSNSNDLAVINLDEGKSLVLDLKKNELKPKLGLNSSQKTKNLQAKEFEIVFGCFAIRNNALAFARKLSGENIQATVHEKNNKGLYVVSYLGFENKQDAVLELQELKAHYPSAWIKKYP